MLVNHRQLACNWCSRTFDRPIPYGRVPQYCKRTCRQRAYEHRRRGALFADHPTQPTPDPFVEIPGDEQPPTYEGSHNITAEGIMYHALRPEAVPDHIGRRTTLCGAPAFVDRRRFYPGHPMSCRTCDKVSRLYPATRHIDPSLDYPVLLAALSRADDDRHRVRRQHHPADREAAELDQILARVIASYSPIDHGPPPVPDRAVA